MSRVAISKKARFEVFKRDGFVCVYCGAHPPSVILHVDHLIAVANGGTNEETNLVTACECCNLGKGARRLDSLPQPLAEFTQEIAEKEEQLAGYRAVVEARKARLQTDCDLVHEEIKPFLPEGYVLTESAQRSIKRFLEKLDIDEILEAVDIAYTREAEDPFRYFCAVCWNKIRGQQDDG